MTIPQYALGEWAKNQVDRARAAEQEQHEIERTNAGSSFTIPVVEKELQE